MPAHGQRQAVSMAGGDAARQVLSLQRRIGNQATRLLLGDPPSRPAGQGSIGASSALAVAPAESPREREADRVADQVMRMPDPAGAAPATRTEDPPQASAAPSRPGMTAPPIVHQVLNAPASPLDAASRAFFEPRLGRDLSRVRVHAGAHAAASARAIGAQAYTVGEHVVLGAGRPSGQRGLLAHELAHVAQPPPGGIPVVQRKPAEDGETEGKQEEDAPLFALFLADERKRNDVAYARRLAREDAAELRRSPSLATEDRQVLKAKHDFFEGKAKAAYADGIRTALLRATEGEREGEIEMPAMRMRRRHDPAAGPPPIRLLSLDYSGPDVCGGRCVTDEEIYAATEKSRLEDAQAEGAATARRKVRAEDLKDLQEDVDRTQRGTRQHRRALERLETFRETGVKPRPYVNMEGGPGPANIGFGILAAVAVGGALIAEGLAMFAASDAALATTYTAARVTQTVASNPLVYAGAAVTYGAVMPPGSPDLPGPFDDAGKALRNLGVAAEEVEQFAKGGKVWGDIARGKAKLLPYFEVQAGKLTAGILSAHWHGDKEGMIRAFLVFRQQAGVLAKAVGAQTIRLEADVVMNTKELLPSLLKMGFKEIADRPGSYFLELAVQ